MTEQRKVIIYTEKSFLPEGKQPVILLYPFWEHPQSDVNDPDHGRFDDYLKNGKKLFDITDQPASADVFLMPFEFSFDEKTVIMTKELAAKAKQHGKKLMIFFNSDLDMEIPIENAIIFRTSFYKHLQKTYEYAFPGWSVDFMKLNNTADADRSYSDKPIISYCGYVDYITLAEKYNIRRIIKKAISKPDSPENIGPNLRGKAVRTLLKSDRVKTNFVIRNGFWAPGMDKKKAREEYVNNIFQSDYALVARGGGNFSYRLLEVLSCGRIPVFINTDCVLPFDQYIDWKNYVLWIEEKDLNSIGERLLEFHKKMTPEELKKKKEECRKLYETWLSPLAFFSNIHKCLN